MIKQISFFKRKEGISVEDFQNHWRTVHAELVVKLPNLLGYVQNHTHASGYLKHEPDFDGVAEVWFDSTDAMRGNVGSDVLQAIRDDEHDFIDRSSMGTLLTEEVVIVDGPRPPGGVKSIAFLNKRDDVTPEFFQQHWRTQHTNIASVTVPRRESLLLLPLHVLGLVEQDVDHTVVEHVVVLRRIGDKPL